MTGAALTGASGDDFWIFAYGSLLWAPGFEVAESRPARLEGYHRAFCIKSIVYRGTPARPGLVLGLAPGGRCDGRLYRVVQEAREEVLAYLRRREQVTRVYLERMLPVACPPGGPVRALVFVADPEHPQYAGDLDLETAARMIVGAEGPMGPCRDYLENTWAHLRALEIEDAALEALVAQVHRLA